MTEVYYINGQKEYRPNSGVFPFYYKVKFQDYWLNYFSTNQSYFEKDISYAFINLKGMSYNSKTFTNHEIMINETDQPLTPYFSAKLEWLRRLHKVYDEIGCKEDFRELLERAEQLQMHDFMTIVKSHLDWMKMTDHEGSSKNDPFYAPFHAPMKDTKIQFVRNVQKPPMQKFQTFYGK